MPYGGPKLLKNFLLPALNSGRYGDALRWESEDVFQLRWVHKSCHQWSQEDAAVFQDWDKLKKKFAPWKSSYHCQSKQRFRAALHKLPYLKELEPVYSDNKKVLVRYQILKDVPKSPRRKSLPRVLFPDLVRDPYSYSYANQGFYPFHTVSPPSSYDSGYMSSSPPHNTAVEVEVQTDLSYFPHVNGIFKIPLVLDSNEIVLCSSTDPCQERSEVDATDDESIASTLSSSSVEDFPWFAKVNDGVLFEEVLQSDFNGEVDSAENDSAFEVEEEEAEGNGYKLFEEMQVNRTDGREEATRSTGLQDEGGAAVKADVVKSSRRASKRKRAAKKKKNKEFMSYTSSLLGLENEKLKRQERSQLKKTKVEEKDDDVSLCDEEMPLNLSRNEITDLGPQMAPVEMKAFSFSDDDHCKSVLSEGLEFAAHEIKKEIIDFDDSEFYTYKQIDQLHPYSDLFDDDVIMIPESGEMLNYDLKW